MNKLFVVILFAIQGCSAVSYKTEVASPPEQDRLYSEINTCFATSEQIAKSIFKNSWSTKNLNQELRAIAYNESYNNKYLDHVPSVNGPYQTAFGPLGFKPSTAHMEWKSSPKMMAEYPGLDKPLDFLAKFTTDPIFYNKLANNHFWRLKYNSKGDAVRAAYGWRFGPGFLEESMVVISQDAYIVKFIELTGFPVIFEQESSYDNQAIDSDS